jgi:hypothetical protein
MFSVVSERRRLSVSAQSQWPEPIRSIGISFRQLTGTSMQVIDTHVRNSLDGTVTVEFTGEGSELVSVRMLGVDGSLDGDHAVLRAKEVMVQITAFGDATKYETSPHISTGLDAAAASGPVVDPLQGVTPGTQIRAD